MRRRHGTNNLSNEPSDGGRRKNKWGDVHHRLILHHPWCLQKVAEQTPQRAPSHHHVPSFEHEHCRCWVQLFHTFPWLVSLCGLCNVQWCGSQWMGHLTSCLASFSMPILMNRWLLPEGGGFPMATGNQTTCAAQAFLFNSFFGAGHLTNGFMSLTCEFLCWWDVLMIMFVSSGKHWLCSNNVLLLHCYRLATCLPRRVRD